VTKSMRAVRDMDLTRTARQHAAAFTPRVIPRLALPLRPSAHWAPRAPPCSTTPCINQPCTCSHSEGYSKETAARHPIAAVCRARLPPPPLHARMHERSGSSLTRPRQQLARGYRGHAVLSTAVHPAALALACSCTSWNALAEAACVVEELEPRPSGQPIPLGRYPRPLPQLEAALRVWHHR